MLPYRSSRSLIHIRSLSLSDRTGTAERPRISLIARMGCTRWSASDRSRRYAALSIFPLSHPHPLLIVIRSDGDGRETTDFTDRTDGMHALVGQRSVPTVCCPIDLPALSSTSAPYRYQIGRGRQRDHGFH